MTTDIGRLNSAELRVYAAGYTDALNDHADEYNELRQTDSSWIRGSVTEAALGHR